MLGTVTPYSMREPVLTLGETYFALVHLEACEGEDGSRSGKGQ